MSGDVFAGRLLPGERVLWTGRPSQGLLLTSRDIFLIPFSILWCGFAIFWDASVAGITGGVRSSGADGSVRDVSVFMLIFGAAFVCVGLVFVFGRFLIDAWIRRSLSYALTDGRVLIDRRGPFKSFTAIPLDRLPELQLKERNDRSGTIRFGQRSSIFRGSGFGVWFPSLDATPQFLAISDARTVFDLIQRRTVASN